MKLFRFTLVIFTVIAFFVVAPLTCRAVSANIAFSPSSGSVGDKIEIQYTVTNDSAEARWVLLRIFAPDDISSDSDYSQKSKLAAPANGETKTYTYNWDTKSSGSVDGRYRIDIVVTKDLARDVLYAESSTYNLAKNGSTTSSSGTETAGGQSEPDSSTYLASKSASKDGDNPWAGNNGSGLTEDELRNKKNIGEYMTTIYKYGIPIAASLAGLMMIYAGYLYMMSGSNPEFGKTARDIWLGALLGLLLIILAGVVLKNVVGINY